MKHLILFFSLSLLLFPALFSQEICLTGVNKYQKVDEFLLMLEVSLMNKEAELQLSGKEISLSLTSPITSKKKKHLEGAVLELSKKFGKDDLEQFREMVNQLRLESKNDVKHQNDILAIEMLMRIINTRKE